MKFLNRLLNTFLALSGIAAVIGLAYTLNPDYFTWIFEQLNMTNTEVVYATTVLSGIAIFGSSSKYLSSLIKSKSLMMETENKRRLQEQYELHQEELRQIKSSRNEELILFTEIINDLINATKINNAANDKILENLAITAKRNINSPLVSEEDKELYRKFLEGLEDNKVKVDIKNLYTSINHEEITIIEDSDYIDDIDQDYETNATEDEINENLDEIEDDDYED